MTHQRHFLPHCDRILVLKGGFQHALGTYSQLAPSALTELAQLQQDTELDDSVYDNQIPNRNGQLGQKAQTALQGMLAGPVQATVDAEVPAAAAAASHEAHAADQGLTGQQDGALAASVPPDSLATLATAATAATAVAADTSIDPSNQCSIPQALLPLQSTAATTQEATMGQQARLGQVQGHQQPSAFCPGQLVPKKIVLPPRVDLRWGPIKLGERWVSRLRGHGKADKASDQNKQPEIDALGKEHAQLNQQEARATGQHFAYLDMTWAQNLW